MKKLALLLATLSLPSLALAATWENVGLVDNMCGQKEKVKGNLDAHPTSCLLKCAGSGYSIVTSDGTQVKLDKAGNEKAVAALKKTSKKDHIKVNVTGEKKGDEIAVSSLEIPE
jgi:hypothetical protein